MRRLDRPILTPHRSGIKMKKKGIEVQGSRRGRPEKRWADRVKDDLREKGLPGEVYEATRSSHIDPT